MGTKYYLCMRVIAKKILREFWMIHPDEEQSLKSWYREADMAKWASPHDIKKAFPSASIINDEIVVFNIKGNRFRLIVKINYSFSIIWIRFIGTHSEYDKLNIKNW